MNGRLPNRPLQPPHSAVRPLACATGAPAGGLLNGGVRWRPERMAGNTVRDIARVRPGHFLLLAALCWGLIVPTADGSDLGCSNLRRADASLYGPGDLRLVRVAAPSLSLVGQHRQHVRATYEALKWGWGARRPSSVEFVAIEGKDVSPPFALVPERELLVFAAVRDGNREQWWELVNGSEGKPTPLVNSGSLGYGDLSFRRATPIPSLPLFVFSYPEFRQTMYSQDTTTHQLVLDFREVQPRILVSLNCSCTDPAGGNCSPYDVDFYQRTELGCDWSAAAQDFLCTQVDVLPLGWGQRRAARRFLLKHEPLPSPDPAPGPRRQPKRGDPVNLAKAGVLGPLEIAGAGPLRAVYTGFMSKSTGVFTVYVGQGTSPVFDVRFFAVALWPGREQILEIVPKQLDIDGTLFGWSALHGEPSGKTPDASVKALAVTEPGLHVLQVVATDQNARGLYLIGVEESDAALVAGGLMLATDATYYSRCGEYLVPENAIAVEYGQDPFAARLWLEPSFHVETYPGDLPSIRKEATYAVLTPTQATLCWQMGQGFRMERQEPRPGYQGPALLVVVSGDGQIAPVEPLH